MLLLFLQFMAYHLPNMSRYSRVKGHTFERLCAREFRDMGFKDAKTKRQARGGDWSTTDDGIDLVGTGKFLVQCKCLQNYVSVNTIEEVKGEGIPIVVTKANSKEPMAILPWNDLKHMIQMLKEIEVD